MREIETEADIDRLVRGAKALAALTAWNEGGLLHALKDGPRPIDDLPGDPRALRATAAVLRHVGLLVGDQTVVGLSPAALRLLDAGGMPTARNFDLLKDLAETPDVLTHGKPVLVTEGGVTQDPDAARAFLEMLHRRSAESARETVLWTRSLLPARGGHVLDLGGGHGRYAACYVEAGHQATLIDKAHVIPVARDRYDSRLRYISGDFMEMSDLGGPYDLVLLSNIVHGLSADDNLRLLRKIACSTRPGGAVVLKDFFLDPSGRFDERAAFFGMTMLFYTAGGAVYTHAEVAGWLAEAGFEAPTIAALDSFELIRARRAEGA